MCVQKFDFGMFRRGKQRYPGWLGSNIRSCKRAGRQGFPDGAEVLLPFLMEVSWFPGQITVPGDSIVLHFVTVLKGEEVGLQPGAHIDGLRYGTSGVEFAEIQTKDYGPAEGLRKTGKAIDIACGQQILSGTCIRLPRPYQVVA